MSASTVKGREFLWDVYNQNQDLFIKSIESYENDEITDPEKKIENLVKSLVDSLNIPDENQTIEKINNAKAYLTAKNAKSAEKLNNFFNKIRTGQFLSKKDNEQPIEQQKTEKEPSNEEIEAKKLDDLLTELAKIIIEPTKVQEQPIEEQRFNEMIAEFNKSKKEEPKTNEEIEAKKTNDLISEDLEKFKDELSKEQIKHIQETATGFYKCVLHKDALLEYINHPDCDKKGLSFSYEVIGVMIHLEDKEQSKMTVEESPKVFQEAYKLAKGKDIVESLFRDAILKKWQGPCLEARYRDIADWMIEHL